VSAALSSTGAAGTGGVSIDTSRLASKDNLKAAGDKFEAVFTGMMLKSMRAAKLGEGLFDSKAGDQFRDMQDQKLAESMATHAPIGIGKAMTDFLAKSAAATEAAATAEASAAGTTTSTATSTGARS
jgi:flagellar protein FlgJ